MDVTLDCGCHITAREEWEYGCAGDCHPGTYVWGGGVIKRTCERHTPVERGTPDQISQTIEAVLEDRTALGAAWRLQIAQEIMMRLAL